MGFRRRNYEFEADLYRVPMPWFFKRELGELERTSYQDGEEKLKISVKGIEAPDGASIDVFIDGTRVATLTLESGRARQILSSTRNDSIPEVKEGQEVEVRWLGNPVLAGVFERD